MSDNWKTGSGLPDDFDFEVTHAEFRYNPKVQDGEVPICVLVGLNSETGDPEDELRFTVGKNFEVVDKGAAVEPTFAKAKINHNSQYGKWINSFLANEEAMALVKARDMDPFVAASWVGLKLSLERVLTDTTIRGESITMTSWIVHDVTEIETSEGERKPAKKTAAKKAAAKKAAPKAEEPAAEAEEAEAEAPAETEAAESQTKGVIPPPVKAVATDIARKAGTYEDYINGVYEHFMTDLVGAPHETALTDRAFYDAAVAEEG